MVHRRLGPSDRVGRGTFLSGTSTDYRRQNPGHSALELPRSFWSLLKVLWKSCSSCLFPLDISRRQHTSTGRNLIANCLCKFSNPAFRDPDQNLIHFSKDQVASGYLHVSSIPSLGHCGIPLTATATQPYHLTPSPHKSPCEFTAPFSLQPPRVCYQARVAARMEHTMGKHLSSVRGPTVDKEEEAMPQGTCWRRLRQH